MKRKTRSPEIVLKDGKPSAVILAIDDYQEILERLEDLEDLRYLQEVRRKGTHFRRFEECVKEQGRRV